MYIVGLTLFLSHMEHFVIYVVVQNFFDSIIYALALHFIREIKHYS